MKKLFLLCLLAGTFSIHAVIELSGIKTSHDSEQKTITVQATVNLDSQNNCLFIVYKKINRDVFQFGCSKIGEGVTEHEMVIELERSATDIQTIINDMIAYTKNPRDPELQKKSSYKAYARLIKKAYDYEKTLIEN